MMQIKFILDISKHNYCDCLTVRITDQYHKEYRLDPGCYYTKRKLNVFYIKHPSYNYPYIVEI